MQHYAIFSSSFASPFLIEDTYFTFLDTCPKKNVPLYFKNPEIIATSDTPVFNKLSQLNSEIKSINIKHNDSHNIYNALLINNSFTILKQILRAENKLEHYTIFKIAYQNLYNLRCRIPIKIKDFELYTNKWLNF